MKLGLGLSINRSMCAVKPPEPPEPDYQQWYELQDSEVLTIDYPYQVILWKDPYYTMYVSQHPLRVSGASLVSEPSSQIYYAKASFSDPHWFNSPQPIGDANVGDKLYVQANRDVYTDATLTDVRFKKTTGNRQQWSGFPESPASVISYPYQLVYPYSGQARLWVSDQPFYVTNPTTYKTVRNNGSLLGYQLYNEKWVITTFMNPPCDTSVDFAEANADVFRDSPTSGVVYFAKTT